MKFAALFLVAIASLSAFADETKAPEATYEVPVPAELAPFSIYKLEKLNVVKAGGLIELSYQLPLDLTGEENTVVFQGQAAADGSVNLVDSRSGASLICRAPDEQAQVCRAHYYALKINAKKVEQRLRDRGLDELSIAGHLGVTARFGGDMIGIVTLPNENSAY